MGSDVIFRFRLYIARDSQNSMEALANLQGICDRYLKDCYKLEVIDVIMESQRALADGIRMTPTLIKHAPAPFRKIVGTLAHTQRVLLALDLAAVSC
jgi:circadian clock protein KaiB